MTTDLLSQLRATTDEARRIATDEDARRAAAERATADAIIRDIPSLALAEARQGRQTAAIMLVSYAGRPEFELGVGYTLEPQMLTGPSRLVWESCVAQQLAPHLVPRWTTLDSGVHRIDFVLCVGW